MNTGIDHLVGKPLTEGEKDTMAIMFKFRIDLLNRLKLETSDTGIKNQIQTQIDQLVSSAIKLELP